MEGARRTAKRNQSGDEWWRGPGEQRNTLRAGKSWQTNTLRARRSGGWGPGGQPNALRAGRSGGGGQEESISSSVFPSVMLP